MLALGKRMTDFSLQGGFSLHFTMNQAHVLWPFAHSCNKAQQAGLVGMRRVTAERANVCADINTLVVDIDITAAWAIFLNQVAQCALRLIADKQHIVARLIEHGFEIVDDAATAAHAATGNHNGWTFTVG